jgi:hypothetical protein
MITPDGGWAGAAFIATDFNVTAIIVTNFVDLFPPRLACHGQGEKLART